MAARLLEPIAVRNMRLSNRLVMPPMATGRAHPDRGVSPEMLAYYKEKSSGGYIGLVIIEHSYISADGRAHDRQLSVADDSVIPGLKELAEVIHGQGSKTVMQINHAGSSATEKILGAKPVAPSAVDNPLRGSPPRELGRDEIAGIVCDFAAAAGRAWEAGFDGVELHAAHGFLLNQFFSPLTNRRQDEYGGDVLNRIRIHLEIVKAIRETVGQEFPILVRLGAADYREGGTTIDDSMVAARALEAAGVDLLDVSAGFCGFPETGEQGFFAPLSEAIKRAVNIPVILTGGIREAGIAEQLLQDGKADLIGVGRAIMSDSLWAKKAVESLQGR